jgi:hypothetical protein
MTSHWRVRLEYPDRPDQWLSADAEGQFTTDKKKADFFPDWPAAKLAADTAVHAFVKLVKSPEGTSFTCELEPCPEEDASVYDKLLGEDII